MAIPQGTLGRPLRVGLYSPFLGSTIGGGEKYFGIVAEAVRDAFPNSVVEILTPVAVDVARCEQLLGLDLHDISFRSVYRGAGGVKARLNRVPMLRRYRDLAVSIQAARHTVIYDLLISMVYVLPAFSRARRGIILCQFPYPLTGGAPKRTALTAALHRIYVQPYLWIRRALLGREIDDFDQVICQSEYVKEWVQRLWRRESTVINPPIDIPEAEPDWAAKRRIILSVGRFFAGGHNKRHDVMVEAFRRLCDDGLRDWELHLAGSLHLTTQADLQYFERVKRVAAGYPVQIHPDATAAELSGLYSDASIYWHAAGYGVDEDANPAQLEHFGMTTVEAMARGAAPVVIARGGQLEVVRDSVNGYLWTDPKELIVKTLELIQNAQLRRQIGNEARRSSLRFTRARFVQEVVDAVRPVLEDLQTRAEIQVPA